MRALHALPGRSKPQVSLVVCHHILDGIVHRLHAAAAAGVDDGADIGDLALPDRVGQSVIPQQDLVNGNK